MREVSEVLHAYATAEFDTGEVKRWNYVHD